MRSWGKFQTKDTKRPKNPTATFEEPGAKTGSWEQKQSTAHAPCTQHHQRGGQITHLGKSPPTPPAGTLDTPLPSPYIRNKLASPLGASKQGNLLFILAPPCCSRDPNKALPEFLGCPLVNFY